MVISTFRRNSREKSILYHSLLKILFCSLKTVSKCDFYYYYLLLFLYLNIEHINYTRRPSQCYTTSLRKKYSIKTMYLCKEYSTHKFLAQITPRCWIGRHIQQGVYLAVLCSLLSLVNWHYFEWLAKPVILPLIKKVFKAHTHTKKCSTVFDFSVILQNQNYPYLNSVNNYSHWL